MGKDVLWLQAVPGTPITIPTGFSWASVNPDSGATYTITNSLSGNGIPNVSNATSPSISVPFTFDSDARTTYNQHVITATGGNVTIAYTSGL